MLLNVITSITLVVGLYFLFKTKNKMYISLVVLVLSSTIFIYTSFLKSTFNQVNKENPHTPYNKSRFASVNTPGTPNVSTPNVSTPNVSTPNVNPINSKLSNAYDTGAVLVRDVLGNNSSGLNNALYVSQALNFNKGDIIALSTNGSILETCIVNDVQYTTDSTNTPVLILLNPLKNTYNKLVTKILKVSDSTPNLIVPPDPNRSIESANGGYVTDPQKMAVANFPKYTLPNLNRYDWNLELSTYGGLEPGQPPNYKYDGQPYGPLKCRSSNLENPMGTINVTEYDSDPAMYGTCNVQENNNDYIMTTNQEATVSQRVNDLLFHKGNSQAQFSPTAVDTMPNDQEAFAHFCYRNPTNLVNPKYASIFVNDPDKFLMVSKLARATGTENGGGGGR